MCVLLINIRVFDDCEGFALRLFLRNDLFLKGFPYSFGEFQFLNELHRVAVSRGGPPAFQLKRGPPPTSCVSPPPPLDQIPHPAPTELNPAPCRARTAACEESKDLYLVHECNCQMNIREPPLFVGLRSTAPRPCVSHF